MEVLDFNILEIFIFVLEGFGIVRDFLIFQYW